MSYNLDVRSLSELSWTWGQHGTSASTSFNGVMREKKQFTYGTLSGEADAVWYNEDASLSRDSTEILALNCLKMQMFTEEITISLNTVRVLMVANRGDSGTLIIGASDSSAWNGPLGAGETLTLPPGSVLFLLHPTSGWAVSSTAYQLKLAASGANVTYSVGLVGTQES